MPEPKRILRVYAELAPAGPLTFRVVEYDGTYDETTHYWSMKCVTKKAAAGERNLDMLYGARLEQDATISGSRVSNYEVTPQHTMHAHKWCYANELRTVQRDIAGRFIEAMHTLKSQCDDNLAVLVKQRSRL